MKSKINKGFTSINKVLPGRVKAYKLEKAFYKHQAIKYWEEVIVGFIGDAKESARAIDLHEGILIVACLSKEIAYQIKLVAQRIIYSLNQLLGRSVIRAIHIES